MTLRALQNLLPECGPAGHELISQLKVPSPTRLAVLGVLLKQNLNVKPGEFIVRLSIDLAENGAISQAYKASQPRLTLAGLFVGNSLLTRLKHATTNTDVQKYSPGNSHEVELVGGHSSPTYDWADQIKP